MPFFRSVEKSKLRNMLPENIKKIDMEELKSLCVQQLEGMSKKRIRSILDGQPMEGSSGSESSEDSDDQAPNAGDDSDDDEEAEDDENQPDSTSVGVDNNAGYEEISDEDEEDGLGDAGEPAAGDPKKGKKGDILELEMRARAIRSMLEKKKQKGDAPADATKEPAFKAIAVGDEEEEDGDFDVLKLLDDDSPIEDDVEEEKREEVDPEERKMSVRKLAELKMKASQEEVTADSDGAARAEGGEGGGGEGGEGEAGETAKKKPEKNLQMKQAEILKKAAKLRKKKKKENVEGDDGTSGFKINKAKLGQKSFRKRNNSGRRADDDDKRPYSHTYAAYIAAFGDPNMMEYSDSYGAANHSGEWQPRELSVEEEVRALLDELIYRVDPYVSFCFVIVWL